MTKIADNLKRLRTQNRFTQSEVADILNVKPQTYNSWENGKTDIKGDFIPKIAELFKVKIEELYKDETKKVNSKFTDNAINNGVSGTNYGVIIVLTDKEDVEKILEYTNQILKK